MTIDDLFALREQMQEVLSAKLKAKKVDLERRLQALNQQSKLIETMKPGLQGLLLTFGHCGCAISSTSKRSFPRWCTRSSIHSRKKSRIALC